MNVYPPKGHIVDEVFPWDGKLRAFSCHVRMECYWCINTNSFFYSIGKFFYGIKSFHREINCPVK